MSVVFEFRLGWFRECEQHEGWWWWWRWWEQGWSVSTYQGLRSEAWRRRVPEGERRRVHTTYLFKEAFLEQRPPMAQSTVAVASPGLGCQVQQTHLDSRVKDRAFKQMGEG